jgi:hypothetical protein
MSSGPAVEKEAVLSYLADQVVAKEAIVARAQAEMDELSDSNDVGNEDWLPPMLTMTAAKAMKAAFEKTAEHVLSLEEL